MKIDKTNKIILFELTQNARTFDSNIAKKTNKSKETIRYRINNLEENQIITGYLTWFDPSKLGYTSGKIYLQLKNDSKRQKEFVDFVTKDKRLFWLGIAQGAWNAGLTYFVKSQREFFRLKNDLFDKFHDIILESKTAILVQVQVGPKTIFCKSTEDYKILFEEQGSHVLDEASKAVLKVLMKNARSTVVEIANKTNNSIEVVRNRIKSLEENQIIKGYSASIDHKKLGLDFYKTFIYIKEFSKEIETKFDEYCLKDENITHVVKQNSAWDIELEILAKNYLDYQETINKLTHEFPENIARIETAIMLHDYVWPSKSSLLD